MIDLEYIVKTSLMLLLKRIIRIFLIILLLAEFVLLVLKVSELNFSLYYWVGVSAVSYLFIYFVTKLIMKILDLYDNWR